ncbi:MAG: acyltransferase family protein [Granulosicoccus sp.]
MHYRPEIDGLRAIAVIPVVLFHAGFGQFEGGFVGVDVFFVLSGFLITGIIARDLELNQFDLAHFYERRARRILPALIVVMLFCLPLAWWLMLPLQIIDFVESLVATSFFFSNHLFLSESGYFDSQAALKPLLHTWSLSVEEQFYLVFPIFLILSWRSGKRRLLRITFVLALISFALCLIIGPTYPVGNYYLAPTRAWELLAGSIAWFCSRSVISKKSDVLALLGLLAVIGSFIVYDETYQYPGVYTLLPVLGTVLIVLFAHSDSQVAKLLSARPLVAVGLISYSAYLWHQPLFAYARIYFSTEPDFVVMAFLSVTTFFLAALSRRYVELPFIQRQPLYISQKAFTVVIFNALIMVSAVTIYAYESEGTVGRYTRTLLGDVSHSAFNKHIENKYYPCENRPILETALVSEGFTRCFQSQPGTPEYVLLGDSHAEHLFPGMAESLKDKNIAYYIQSGLAFLDHHSFATILSELLESPADQTIMLSMHYVHRVSDANTLYSGLSKTISSLKAAGHEVVLFGDVPRFTSDPQTCTYLSRMGKPSDNCEIDIARVSAQRAIYEDALVSLSRELDVPYIELSSPFCLENSCSMVSGDYILYRDTNHLNLQGSRIASNHIVRSLARHELTRYSQVD